MTVCLFVPRTVHAAGTLQLEAAAPDAEGKTDVSVSYSGKPELGAADIIIELHGDLRTRTDSGEIGADPDNSSWVREGDTIYISMISHGGFTGVLAEIPIQVGPDGGTVRLLLDRAYDLLPFNVTDDVEIHNSLLTFESERIPDESEATAASRRSTAETKPQAQTEASTSQTSSGITVTESSAETTFVETVLASIITETESVTVSTSVPDTDAPSTNRSSANTQVTDTSAEAVDSGSGSEKIPEEGTLQSESATGSGPSETMIESSVPSLTGAETSSDYAPGNDDPAMTETGMTEAGAATALGSDNPAESEQADIGSGSFTQNFNRVLRVLITILLFAVVASIIIYIVSARRRR